MTEETIFAAALDKPTPAERSAFLDEACAGDTALRQRIEALIGAHDQAADFLEQPALEQIALGMSSAPSRTDAIRPDLERIAPDPPGAFLGPTQAERSQGGEDEPSLDFLAPSERPGALGRIGHYHVLAVIGRGGMGVVLKAFDEELQRVVAIKVMAPQLAATASARKRFRREAQAAAAVRDEHVIDIHAVEEVSGLPYLVMEYVNGISLQDRLDQCGPLELKEILRIGMQTAAGLAKAHAQGLIHRDIKPANILLENGVQRVKITDFGLARAVDDASLTQSGVIAGTPQYMAPEQARGESIDHRADLFSLGSVLYAMCTGHPPFRASSVMAVLKRVSEDTPRPIRELNPDIPDWLCAIIDKLHAKEPAQRFSSSQEVADSLGQHLAHLQQPSLSSRPLELAPTPPAHPIASPPARRWAVAAAVLVLLGGLGLTEATGITKLTATVIRVFSPDGTLIVEVDDPNVRVSIDGEDIRILGAGPQEVRVRPGKHHVRATKDGQPLSIDQELVTIARGGKEIVRVRREGETARQTAAPARDFREARRFEGHAGPAVAEARPRATIQGTSLSSVAFSADGRFLALGSMNTVQVWDQAARKQLFILRGHRAWVWTVAFSPDGKTLASACMDGSVKLWDLSTGQCRATLEGHTNKVWDVAFSPEGRALVSASEDNSVRLWDVATAKPRKVLGTHDSHAFAALFTADGRGVVSADINGDVRLWEVASGKVLAHLNGHAAVVRLALSADGKTLATASHDRTVKLWDLGARRLLRTLEGHTLPVERAAFSPDGRLLATVSGEFREPRTAGEVKLWDVASGRELLSFKGHQGPVHGVAFAPDGQTLATASADGTAKLWDVPRPDPKPLSLPGHTSMVWCAAWAPDGRTLASASQDKTVRIWKQEGGGWQLKQVLEAHPGGARSATFSRNGKILATGGHDATVKLWHWDGTRLHEGRTLRGHKHSIHSVAFAPDGKLASGGGPWPQKEPGEVKVWDIRTGKELASFTGHKVHVNALTFSPDGKLLATASADFTVKLWDTAAWKPVAALEHTDGVNSVAFAPDGNLLAAGTGDNTITLWKRDGDRWPKRKTLIGHRDALWPVAFHPDGKVLASGSHDKTIRLWDVATGKELATLQGHTGRVWALAFAPDGKILATGGDDKVVKLWDVSR